MLLTPFVDRLPIPKVIKPKQYKAGVPFYKIGMRSFQQTFHRDLPPSTLWGYEGQYPGPTFIVNSGEPIIVRWENHLPEKHLFAIDHTVHGAGKDVPDVRTVVHLHGGVTEEESDGYPEAWFTRGFQQVGRYFRKKNYHYSNSMPASTLWYHDHALGLTRLNVYAGLAGMYIVRDQQEKEMGLPEGAYEIPLVIQDKTINEDGTLYYPTQRTPPVKELSVSIVSEFFGNVNVVNGKVTPYLEVEPRKYRFRLLNAANSRFYRLHLDSQQYFYVIGTEGGFLAAPVGVGKITLSPGERLDLIIDFTNMEGREIIMANDAPAPFPSGDLPTGETLRKVIQFKVNKPLMNIDMSRFPSHVNYKPLLEKDTVTQRFLTLDEKKDTYGRPFMLLNNMTWDEPISEISWWGTSEVWCFVNTTDDSHPMHIHLGPFQILDRTPFAVDEFTKTKRIVYSGVAKLPEPEEQGWKDTVRANPGEVTRVIKKFDTYKGLYVWHCHILEHEDYEMMRPFVIIK